MTQAAQRLIRKIGASAYSLPLAALVAAILLAFNEFAHQQAQRQLVLRESLGAARIELITLGRRLSEAESAFRGYLLTQDVDDLKPAQVLREQSEASLRTMRDVYSAQELQPMEQQRQVLARAVDTRLSEMAEVMRMARSGQRAAALELLRSGIGAEHMAEVRRHIDRLSALHQLEAVRRVDSIRQTLQVNRVGVIVITLGALVLVALLLRQGRRLERQQAEQHAAVAAERDRLEREVVVRTGELTELARHLESAREDERAHLARELHDELGALLTAAKLDVARIKPKLQSALPDLMPRLMHLTETLNDGIALKRRIIEDLRPSTLSNLGLVAALENLCQEFGNRLGVPIDLELQPVRLPPASELTVYRMVQEGLTNIGKYAQPKSIMVRVEDDDAEARVLVRDDGIGFDVGDVAPSTHGLLGMRYRIAAEGGHFQVTSAPGAGTTLLARLPQSATPADPPPEVSGTAPDTHSASPHAL